MIPEPSGILLIDKPGGWTSHDVVAFTRKFFPRKTKVGHSGTLDPMATGLLVLLVGRATKTAASYQGLSKVYTGTFRLGVETDTGDIEGRILNEKTVPAISESELRGRLQSYRGDVELPIPKFSAVKHKGKPLYAYARKGEETPEKRRTTRIDSWDLLSWTSPEASFRVACASGTYVRALTTDLGQKIGCAAVLSALRRESVGDYKVSEAIDIDGLKRAKEAVFERLLPPAKATDNA